MAYTLNRGIDTGGLDRIQRGLLIGLLAIAVILSFGAVLHRGNVNNPAGNSTKVIPIVSTLKVNNGSAGSKNSEGSSTPPSSASSGASLQGSSLSPAAGSTSSPIASGGGSGGTTSSGGTSSGGTIGGRGGGPIGGSGGSTGGVTIPDCSLNQIASVTCRVPACSPAVTLSPGQKAILGVGGACVVLN